MLIISTKEEQNKYFDSPDMNQSKLKTLVEGDPREMLSKVNKKSPALLLGGVIDSMLFNLDFQETYYVSELESLPTEAIKKIIDTIYQDQVKLAEQRLRNASEATVVEENVFNVPQLESELALLPNMEAKIYNACIEHQYYKGARSQDFYVKEILKEGAGYYKSLVLSANKEIISKEEETKALNIMASLKANPLTSIYFDRDFINEPNNLFDVYYQKPIYFTIKGVKCKALLDILIVSYKMVGNRKTITKVNVIDLKSTADFVLLFHRSVLKYRYDFQQSFYKEAVVDFISKEEQYDVPLDIEIHNQFIVERSTKTGFPLVLNVSEEVLSCGKFGDESLGKKGFLEAIDNYLLYEKEGFKFENLAEQVSTKCAFPTLKLRKIEFTQENV